MKIVLYLSFFLFSVSLVQAQSVSGGVVNPDDQPISYADVVLYDQKDSTMVKVGFTDENGRFELATLRTGSFYLQVNFVGFTPYNSKPFLLTAGDKQDIGVLKMRSSNQLDEVTVSAKKQLIEVLPDRTKFNVEGSINAQGSDAFELLRKAPGVVVDNNDNISLMGKNGVRVFINGRPSPLSGDDLAAFLKSLNSNDISSIDIITNPGARYEAEGNAGIIDIRLKKNEKHGANANINLGLAQGITPKGMAGVTANYRNNKINAYGNYSYRQGIHHNWAEFYREQVGQIFESANNFRTEQRNHNVRVGLDYDLTSKQSIGVMASGNFTDHTVRTNTKTEIKDLNSEITERWLISSNTDEGQRDNLDFNIHYNYKLKEGSNLSLDLDYGLFDRESDSFQPNTYTNATRDTTTSQIDFRALTPIDINIYSFKADYDQNYLGGKFSAGVKSRRVVTDNTYAFYELVANQELLDMTRSNQFLYDEWVNAGYLEFKKQQGKWGWSAGLRAEYTLSEGELSDLDGNLDRKTPRDYLDFFPSLGVSFNPNRKNAFNFNYSRRIDRPNYQDLNPFEFKMSELSFRKGNAFLDPQYTHSLKVSHTFNYRLTTSLSYSYVDDFFAQLMDTINQEASFIMIDNLATQQVWNLNVSYPFSINQWWNGYANVNGGYVKNKANYGEGKVVDLAVPTFNMYAQTSFILPKGFVAELSGWYNAGGLWGGIFENRPMGGVDAGLQYNFQNDRGNIKFSVGDLFNSMVWGGESDFGAQYVDATGGWESRQYRLNITYLLGNQKVKKNRGRKTGIDEEKDRMNSNGGPGGS